MPRKSVKENKNIYFQSREKAELTREAAAEVTFLSKDRIERIEAKNFIPHPDEVLSMAKAYKDPILVNQFCTCECPIGKKYIPRVDDSELAKIVLQIMDSVNGLSENRDRLISIAADGIIDENEKPDFQNICAQLENISTAATTLKFWMEKKLED